MGLFCKNSNYTPNLSHRAVMSRQKVQVAAIKFCR